MPLSEHEQRMLAEIESALYAEDPTFATAVRRTSAGRRRIAPGIIALVLAGVALLVVGLLVDLKPGGFPVISVLGFLLMFAAGVLALRSSPGATVAGPGKRGAGAASGRTGSGAATAGGGPRRPRSARGGSGSYTERMEDRFKRRFEG